MKLLWGICNNLSWALLQSPWKDRLLSQHTIVPQRSVHQQQIYSSRSVGTTFRIHVLCFPACPRTFPTQGESQPFQALLSQHAYVCHSLFWAAKCCSTSGWSFKTNLLFLQSRQTHEKRQDRLATSDEPAVAMLRGSGEACTSPFGEQLLFACSWWSQLHLETRSEPIKHRGRRLLGSGACKAGRQGLGCRISPLVKKGKERGGKKSNPHSLLSNCSCTAFPV